MVFVKKTIEAAKEILNFDLSVIALAKDNRFIPAAASGKIDLEKLPDSVPIDYGIIGKSFKNNESYIKSRYRVKSLMQNH